VLYRSLIGTPGCTWHADYPTAENIANDLAHGNLYIVRDQDGRLIGAATVGDATELVAEITKFDTARVTLRRPCELARFGVQKDQQGRGLGRFILTQALEIARSGRIETESAPSISVGDLENSGLDDPRCRKDDKKYDGLCLLVSPENAAALHLYQQAGFRNQGGLFNWGFQWDYLELRF